VKPAPFDYARARSVEHAVELLGREGARVLAGGQSLIATLNMRLSHPSLLVDINEIAGLDRIARRNGHIEIGALVRHAQAERAADIAQAAPLVARALRLHRRFDRLRRSGGGTAGVFARARRRGRDRRAGRQA